MRERTAPLDGYGSLDTSTPVLILKFVRGRLPHGAITVVRSLGRLGVDVYLVHDHHRAPVTRSRYIRDSYVWDGLTSQPEDTIALLRSIGHTLGRAILIPVDDAATLFVADRASDLRELFVFPDISPQTTSRLADKKSLHLMALDHDIPSPGATFPQSLEDVKGFIKDAVFPVVVKSIDPKLLPLSTDTRSVVITHTAQELLSHYTSVEVPGRPNHMLQEYIPGGPETVWMFNGYFDRDSECLFGATGQKLRQHLPYTGMTTLGVCQENPEVASMARRLLKGIGYQGVVDLGFRHDRRDCRYKLLDINPRVGATFRLFVGAEGLDVVRVLYLDLTGQKVPSSTLRSGRKWLLETHDAMSAMVYHRDGRLSIGDWIRSYRGVQEAAIFALDDITPALLVYLMYANRVLQRVLVRARSIVSKS